MTYIKKEDVQTIISEWTEDYQLGPMKDRINYLPSIDPEVMIEEMIQKLIPKSSFGTNSIDGYKMEALQELLGKFKS